MKMEHNEKVAELEARIVELEGAYREMVASRELWFAKARNRGDRTILLDNKITELEAELKFEHKARMVAEDLNNVLATKIKKLEAEKQAAWEDAEAAAIQASMKYSGLVDLIRGGGYLAIMDYIQRNDADDIPF